MKPCLCSLSPRLKKTTKASKGLLLPSPLGHLCKSCSRPSTGRPRVQQMTSDVRIVALCYIKRFNCFQTGRLSPAPIAKSRAIRLIPSSVSLYPSHYHTHGECTPEPRQKCAVCSFCHFFHSLSKHGIDKFFKGGGGCHLFTDLCVCAYEC